jgi:hypothetical protein
MPTKSPRSETSPTALPDADTTLSPADRVVAERTERRRQRTAVRREPGPAREPDPAGRRNGQREPAAHRPQPRMPLRDTVSVRLIAVLAAGAVLGAILGALSAPGVIIGLLVAGLTVVLSAKLPRSL